MLLTPKYIFADDFSDLADYFKSCPHQDVSFRQREYLWALGEPFHKIFYITEGIVQTFMDHDSGKRRILSFHAQGTVYPMFHYRQYKLEYSLLCSAMTHVKALEFTQEEFSVMFDENADLRHHVIDYFSSATNLLLYEIGHQEQNDSFVKLCNLHYLLLVSNIGRRNYLHSLTQEDLADILGISLNNVTRSLTRLRQDGIIETGRKVITVIDPEKLADLCSGETL